MDNAAKYTRDALLDIFHIRATMGSMKFIFTRVINPLSFVSLKEVCKSGNLW